MRCEGWRWWCDVGGVRVPHLEVVDGDEVGEEWQNVLDLEQTALLEELHRPSGGRQAGRQEGSRQTGRQIKRWMDGWTNKK